MQARENTSQDRTHFHLVQHMYPGHCGYKVGTKGYKVGSYKVGAGGYKVGISGYKVNTGGYKVGVSVYKVDTGGYKVSISGYKAIRWALEAKKCISLGYYYKVGTGVVFQSRCCLIMILWPLMQSETGGRLENLRNSCSNKKVRLACLSCPDWSTHISCPVLIC